MTPEVDDLKFDVERLETAVDVLAASVNAATIRAEKAEAVVARVRALCDEADRAAAMPDEPVVIYTDEVRDALDGEA